MSLLSDALFTTTQKRVLGLLYGQPHRSFYTKEILRQTGMGVATIKNELERMLGAGILNMRKIGNQHHYQANPECPIYQELRGIVNKTVGMADIINTALKPFSGKIHWAFVFGSMASGKDRAGSDIDLMVIGDVTFSEVVSALYPIQEELGREINPKLFRKEEWNNMVKSKDAFIKEVLSKPRVDVTGNEHELG
jgi:predicted nucleotidyltransferase